MATVPVERWLTSRQACERLGVRPQTLYAYVSRGLLTSVRQDGRSRYDPDQVAELARRTARGRRPGRFEVTIDTEITRLEPAGRLSYRGVPVGDLVGRWSYERTAAWLWSGDDRGEPERGWAADPDRLRVAVAAQAGLPDDVAPGARLRVAVAALGAGADAGSRSPDDARTLVATMVAALPVVGPPPSGPRRGSVAAQLWARVSPRRATPAAVGLLDATLVAFADHELATSTLAVRVATSTGAGLEAALLAGLATLSGPLHGAAAEPVRALLADARERGAAEAVEAATTAGGVPGVGHAVYETVDPRTEPLLALLPGVAPPARRAAVAAVVAEMERRRLAPRNADLALGAVLDAGDMVAGAAEVVFAVARTAGWIAHAREEARHRLRYRARAVYTGPR
ncbi:helix-turn-helix domain-containing protein [Iamia sp. SCSIO 61187]|uniref:citrate/2-methylcitrate synthase n=1 Tax=Iamia sp. SCSIO 61187 TaxID=2722752 RepID=UPI001C62B221|nr:citrate/2-methylcitrate synthase [Iamia sp. SCSIO 61187]QYG95089.1 helix-turn-helix domain-containing protein [Iamia sp. SCSIO 61187]